MDQDKLLITEYGYDDIRDAPLQKKIDLERDFRQLKAKSEFIDARANALLTGACCFGSVIAAIVAPPAVIITAPMAIYFADAARAKRDNAILHATSAAMPDSVLQTRIQEYEHEHPPTHIYERIQEGTLAEEPTLSR